ncbi:MAG: ATP-binding protein [Anaerolineales bacterium]|nr:ATP-binding protein [Anaerolineales bacterium]
MPASLRTRLFANHLAVLLLGMGLAALLSWRAVEALYVNTQRENLLAQAQLTAAALQGQELPIASGEPYSQTANVLPGIHTRLLGDQGAVIVGLSATQAGDPVQVPLAENAPFTTPEELLQRPEIAQALQGHPATAIRRVATAQGRRVLYAAAPIRDGGTTVSALVYLAMPLPASGLPASLLLSLAAAALVAVVLAGIAGSLLARRIARPVEEVARAAAAVSTGDLSQHVPAQAGLRELNGLGQAFNRMTENLRHSDQAKNAFVADVTHELRTPLTVIKGTIETLEDGALNDLAGRGPLLASMQRETERLIRLVNDLLVLMRADAGTLQMRLQPLDLADLARARCAHLAAMAAGRKAVLSVRVEETAASCVLGDRDRLSQVLDNLLDNALRYSPEGSTVTVEIHRQGDECECAVHDRGPGISEEHLPLVFERFYRADASRNRQSGGAGLGLAIAKALILAQGGRITAECPPGDGTILRFFLPVGGDCHATD